MKRLIAIALFFIVSVNYLNVIDLLVHFTKSDQSEIVFNIILEEESEKSKEENKNKEKGEDEEKFIHKQFLKTSGNSSIDLNDFMRQASRIESLSYKEALIQPPDFI